MKYNDDGAKFVNLVLDSKDSFDSSALRPEFEALSPEAKAYVVAMFDGWGLRDLVIKHRPDLLRLPDIDVD